MTGVSARPEFEVRTPRVTFDPNSISRADPRYHIALLEDVEGGLTVSPGQVVTVRVPPDEDDELAMVGSARVVDVTDKLIYLDVLGDSFKEEPANVRDLS